MATVYKAVQRAPPGFQRTSRSSTSSPSSARSRTTSTCSSRRRASAASSRTRTSSRSTTSSREDGSYYLVMEWVEGIDLGALHQGRTATRGTHVAWPLAVAIGIGTLRGLGAAHDRRRARRHARAGDPSRRLAAQRPARRQRRRQAVRLRPRARARSRREPDRAGHRQGQAQLPRARGHVRQAEHRAVGSVRRRQRAVGDADRRAPVRRQDRRRDLQEDPRVQDPADRWSAAPTSRPRSPRCSMSRSIADPANRYATATSSRTRWRR